MKKVATALVALVAIEHIYILVDVLSRINSGDGGLSQSKNSPENLGRFNHGRALLP